MKKTLFLVIFFSFICFSAESGLPSIHKTASSTKVKKETDVTSSSGTTSNQTTSLAVLPDGKAYVGVNSYLSLRDEPFGKVGARLYNNQEVIIVNRDGDWYEVETKEGTGWVYGKCVYDSPNSNPTGSPTDTNSNEDDDDDEDDDINSTKNNGTYYYFTFDNPGDYNITFASLNEDEIDDSNESDVSEGNTKQQNLTNDKNTKSKPAKKTDSKKSKKSKKTKSTKSKDNNDKNIDKNSNDNLKAAQVWVDKVFDEILKYKCLHKAPKASSFEQIKKKRRISCTKSSSIVFQQAGIIPKGKIVGHTPNHHRGHSGESFDTALKKSVTNAKYLLKGTCDIVMVMRPYAKCPKWLQTKGIYYIQESNACVSAGNGRIYSCNQTNKRYTKRSMFYRKSGYCKSHPILFAFVPRTNGKSNVPKNSGFKVKAAWGKGSSKIVAVK